MVYDFSNRVGDFLFMATWAQVKYPYGASVEDAKPKRQFDLYYILNSSFFLDFRILLRTARAVLLQQASR